MNQKPRHRKMDSLVNKPPATYCCPHIGLQEALGAFVAHVTMYAGGDADPVLSLTLGQWERTA